MTMSNDPHQFREALERVAAPLAELARLDQQMTDLNTSMQQLMVKMATQGVYPTRGVEIIEVPMPLDPPGTVWRYLNDIHVGDTLEANHALVTRIDIRDDGAYILHVQEPTNEDGSGGYEESIIYSSWEDRELIYPKVPLLPEEGQADGNQSR